jgi:hypothetical protein
MRAAQSHVQGGHRLWPPRADHGRVSRRSGLLPTIAGESMVRNTIPETRERHRLCEGGLLFTSLGAGSVVGAVFIIPWLRSRLSPERLARSGGSFPRELASGLSAFDQLCRKPRRKGFRHLINSYRSKRDDAESVRKFLLKSVDTRTQLGQISKPVSRFAPPIRRKVETATESGARSTPPRFPETTSSSAE